jgi:osmotically-inducible protein OsmY
MNNLPIKNTFKASILVAALGLGSAAMADNNSRYDKDNKLKDAWIDGKVETAFLVNRHLNNFTIDTDVIDNVVYLSGTVKSEVDSDLAFEIAKGIAGVEKVENKLVVEKDYKAKQQSDDEEPKRSLGTWYDDSTTTTVIKSKYLWNGEVDGLDINVDTYEGVVTLQGDAESSAHVNLAVQIAENTQGVRQVVNKIVVVKQ